MANIEIRNAVASDLQHLVTIEEACFMTDRLSMRQFRHWLKADNCIFKVADDGKKLFGYGLVVLHKGTRLARLYSMAISPDARRLGIAKKLLTTLEQDAVTEGRLFMRLEVSENNNAAQALYHQLGYRAFGEYENYYQDQSDALRMQKRIRQMDTSLVHPETPWYQQTTSFTCGPSSLMMAMASLGDHIIPSQELELDIWREATTIFMTSGHGGCHPVGLALAAHHRGFTAKVYINTKNPLFIEGVRSEKKKQVLRLVNRQFMARAQNASIALCYRDITQDDIKGYLDKGNMVIVLISTYRLDGRKLPHWVTVTAVDDYCLYVHDPDPDVKSQDPLDCQHMPIARDDFSKMSVFGSERLRTAVVIRKTDNGT
ncbi:GNAT family N-acetyltransferase/peptidase C39 family protein [Desulforhopalus singaporensis]|uniref:Ribosomal protein S18 acetylase RimI n=1 Tax=Desulforhopalus singaporensis TaxID=91360 RepID=A0A1H0LUD8_9BACT|nr:GNAT family N-acetyltransferase/peptidase C39 family protein [Desulforhopalus singaporensis]SDO71839.1 Ribosomal protein S18 acetylase RimI [Desulforhopalus singaporensis]